MLLRMLPTPDRGRDPLAGEVEMRRTLIVAVLLGVVSALTFLTSPSAIADPDTPDHCGASAPCGRCCMGIAFDRANEELVIFGGTDNTAQTLGDTWTYDVVNGGWTWRNVSGPCSRHSSRRVGLQRSRHHSK